MTAVEREELESLLSPWKEFAGFSTFEVCVIRNPADADLIKKLSNEQCQQLSRLSTASVQRQLEWAEARRCEFAMKDRVRAKISAKSLSEKEAANFSIFTSISHSKNIVVGVAAGAQAVASAAAQTAGLLGVGVDLECTDRKVSEKMRARLVHPGENAFGLELLEYWVIKEACFKATPDNASALLSEYVLREYDPGTRSGEVQKLKSRTAKNQQNDFELQFRLERGRNWVLAMARCVSSVA